MSRFDRLAERLPIARDYYRALRSAFANIPTFENVASNADPESLAWVRNYFSASPLVLGAWIDDATNMARTLVIKGDARDHEPRAAIPCVDEADARRWAAILNTPSDAKPPATQKLRLIAQDGVVVNEANILFPETACRSRDDATTLRR